jgi:hypothetical protein
MSAEEREAKKAVGAINHPITFGEALCITFIVLKLCSVIDWSWWIVLSPMWAPIVLMLFVAGVLFALAGFCDWFAKRSK